MHKRAMPLSIANKFAIDLLQRLRKLRLQKLMANPADSFLLPPAIEVLRAPVPRLYSTVYRASHDAFICIVFMLLRAGHGFLPRSFVHT
jgi:hypothetical protein